MAKERKELIVLDGLTILFIVMLIVNGTAFALLYRWHNVQVFQQNLKYQQTSSDFLTESRRLKNVIVEHEGVNNWEATAYAKTLAFHDRGKKTYQSAGIAVDYPSDYASETAKDGKGLVLMTKEEAERVRNPNAPAGDGPTTISIATFPLEGKKLLDWVKTSKETNFSLSKGEYTPTKLAGIPAIRYEWSGLYEATAYAVEGKSGEVVLLTVTYTSHSDEIAKDFDLILSTLRKA